MVTGLVGNLAGSSAAMQGLADRTNRAVSKRKPLKLIFSLLSCSSISLSPFRRIEFEPVLGYEKAYKGGIYLSSEFF